MEWTRDKTLALINEYRKRRGLWDMTHDDYRKKEMKQKLLLEVATSVGDSIPVVEIEKKFHTLRTQYHREINRMKRKEPYNSKWFGFKNLQFLSSPKACRINKARLKSEITEDGTVTKFVIRECATVPTHESNSVSNSNFNEEIVTIERKPTTTTSVAYEMSSRSAAIVTSTSRSRELEKLIEETTKDVEDIEEAKPKVATIKQITLPLEHHTYGTTVTGSNEIPINEPHSNHSQQQHESEQQRQLEEEPTVETMDIQTNGEEITFQTASLPNGSHHSTLHHQSIPTRIIKIQRRGTCAEGEYYEEEENQNNAHTLHAAAANATTTKHRIFYEADGQQHTAILATPTTAIGTSAALISSSSGKQQRTNNQQLQHLQPQPIETSPTQPAQPQQQLQQQCRDEFGTYGEYIANEMRAISSREILVTLKHKINTAIFEANMAELQK